MQRDMSKAIEAGIVAAKKVAEEYVADNYDDLVEVGFSERAENIADEILENDDFRRIALCIGIEYASSIELSES